jgi:phosphoribosyl-AMP cyclohydrolase
VSEAAVIHPAPINAPWLDQVRWDAQGLVTAIAQDAQTQRVLMVAWMNREALALTAQLGHAVYWSRSRARLWHKGEESGHVQSVREIRLDCDGDAIVLQVSQAGGIACHTGRQSCFFSRLEHDHWVSVDPVLQDPASIYRS